MMRNSNNEISVDQLSDANKLVPSTDEKMSDVVAPGATVDDDAAAATTPPNKKAKTDNNASMMHDSIITKKMNKAKKEKQQVDWARNQKMDDVVLNKDKTEIISISGIVLMNLTAKMLPAFCRENGISVPEKRKTRADCIQYVINGKNGEAFPSKVGTKEGKKIPASTRPHDAPKDEKVPRTILAITHPEEGRSVYVQTNNRLNRSELDKRTGHVENWKELLDMDEVSELDEIDMIADNNNVAEGIVKKNKALMSLARMQRTKLEMELKALKEQNYEALDDGIFDLNEKLLKVRNEIRKTDKVDDKDNWETMMRYKRHLKKKLARARTRMERLQIIMKLNPEDEDESDSNSD